MDVSPPTIGQGRRIYFSPHLPAPGCPPRDPAVLTDIEAGGRRDDELGLMSLLLIRCGLDAKHYRATSLIRRLPACLRALGARDCQHGWRLVAGGSHRLPAALNAVLLGVTGFFRDAPVFEQVEQRILPALFTLSARPRIWSAACSSGQELYSVASMLEAQGMLESCELLGTDCRSEALREAAAGVYPDKPGATDGRPWPGPASGVREVRISSRLRRKVQWKKEDLFRQVEAGPWDLILWRNMAIYLKEPSALILWDRLHAVLRPGGWMVTGRSEAPPAHLGMIRLSPCLFQKPKLKPHGKEVAHGS